MEDRAGLGFQEVRAWDTQATNRPSSVRRTRPSVSSVSSSVWTCLVCALVKRRARSRAVAGRPAADSAGKTNVEGIYLIGDAKNGFSGIIESAAEGSRCAAHIVHEIAAER